MLSFGYDAPTGQAYEDLPDGVRLMKGLGESDDLPFSLHYNFTDEGLIIDVVEDATGDIVGTSSETYEEMLGRLYPDYLDDVEDL